jgi:hypothetical protein
MLLLACAAQQFPFAEFANPAACRWLAVFAILVLDLLAFGTVIVEVIDGLRFV